MQVATFLVAYQPGLDGDYSITWGHQVDGYVHRLLAELAGLGPMSAYLIHVLEAIVKVNRNVVSDLRDPLNEVPVHIAYRVNQLPHTYIARILFYAGDLETFEPAEIDHQRGA